MEQEQSELLCLFYKGIYHYLGKQKTEMYKQARAEFLRSNHRWICSKCGAKTKKKTKSIDHIIPKSILYELELPSLIYDPNNFRLMCTDCNFARGNDTEELPTNIRLLLEKRRAMLDKTETQPV